MICAYETYGRQCRLHAHRGDGREAEYCAYHYARVSKKFYSDEEEYAWFVEWCQTSQRWNLCIWNSSLLWKILCGLVPLTEAPRGSWTCPDEDPWRAVIRGHISQEHYFREQKKHGRTQAILHVQDERADILSDGEG